ncbi:MAG: ATP-binding protein [Oscillospiraceae bacterium]|nr:ATP-binding protein [Oscillospiraceae bacterium]
MTKRIFRSIFTVAAVILLASFVLITGVLYEYFSNKQVDQLNMQTHLAAQGLEAAGEDYLSDMDISGCRLTWIAADGTVLYDSQAERSGMENHADREEVRQALKTGHGESMRYSTTLMERQIYSADRLSDGTVVRISDTQYTPLTLILGMIQPVIIIALIALLLSLLLASRMAKRIVKPLNEMSLDNAEKIETYPELAPLTDKLKSQQNQLREQEKELRRRRDEFDAATGSMTEGLVLLNEQGSVLSINKAATKALDIGRYCIGKDIRALSEEPRLRETVEKALGGEHGEAHITLGGVSYRLYASPVTSGDRVAGAALLMLDTTEKEKAEQLRREFSANVSHELKSPLHTISGCAELLANGIVKPEDVPHFLSQIQSESKRMIALIEDIIKLSHLDEGAEDMQREDVDLLSVARREAGNLSQAAEDAGVTLTVSGESAVINGIPQLLAAIVHNLCENAIKYNHPGGFARVNVRREGKKTLLTVEDDGIGIPPEEQQRIFERFYRVDKSHSKEVGGTGLGLSIVKHAAALHNARISVVSAPDRGTTITLAF